MIFPSEQAARFGRETAENIPGKGAGTMKKAWVMKTGEMQMCRCLCLEWKIHM